MKPDYYEPDIRTDHKCPPAFKGLERQYAYIASSRLLYICIADIVIDCNIADVFESCVLKLL